MNNNYLICGLMVLILILFIVDICKKRKDKEGFSSLYIEFLNRRQKTLNTELDAKKDQKSTPAHNYIILRTLQRITKTTIDQMTDSEKRISALETEFNSHKTDSEKRISALETEFNSHKGGTAIKEHSTF